MLAAIVATAMLQHGQVSLRPGLVITKSATVRKQEYIFPNDDATATQGAIVIKGDDITVDFNGATLRGTPEDTEPDERKGTGLTIEGKNVTVRNLNVHGYKVAIAARYSEGLKIIDCDLSYNWKQHLGSTLDREDTGDWMSYHQNEKDEWLRYGAAIYLRGCNGFEVKGCTAEDGQCGLMMTECNGGLAWNNDFSFLSGIGVGLYRSSNNRIMDNNIDWCVRGYSHGVYNRGQDSAGILIYEQSNDNVFAYNSVTHGGDGFFLWAGQTTMDTGKGGCNGNLLFGNDFSHAPTNGIEATFSKNNFINNLVLECWHGVWGGYSWESKVIGNYFGLNAEGIAWEHGQDNQILYNTFNKDLTAIDMWQKDSEDPNWTYAKVRDTRSRDNTVDHNIFRDIAGPVVHLSRSFNFHFTNNQVFRTSELFHLEKETDGLQVTGNTFTVPYKFSFPKGDDNTWNIDPANTPAKTAMQSSGNLKPAEEAEGADYLRQFQVGWSPFITDDHTTKNDLVRPWAPAQLDGAKVPFLKPGTLRGRKYILVNEWGPYDFKSPIVWPRALVSIPATITYDDKGLQHSSGAMLEQHLEILGPPGTWKVTNTRSARGVSAYSGKVPGNLIVQMVAGKANDVQVDLQYTGEATTDYRGIKTAAGRAIKFSYSRFFAPIDWDVKWFSYDGATQDPRKTNDWMRIMQSTPIYEIKTSELNYAWPGSPGGNVPPDHFLTLATGTFEIAKGDYVLDLTSDDGVRVILDGKTVYEDWTWHGPTNVKVPLKLGGRHSIRIEHFELDGYSTLKALIERRPSG